MMALPGPFKPKPLRRRRRWRNVALLVSTGAVDLTRIGADLNFQAGYIGPARLVVGYVVQLGKLPTQPRLSNWPVQYRLMSWVPSGPRPDGSRRRLRCYRQVAADQLAAWGVPVDHLAKGGTWISAYA